LAGQWRETPRRADGGSMTGSELPISSIDMMRRSSRSGTQKNYIDDQAMGDMIRGMGINDKWNKGRDGNTMKCSPVTSRDTTR
jgi:hypothetical protein